MYILCDVTMCRFEKFFSLNWSGHQFEHYKFSWIMLKKPELGLMKHLGGRVVWSLAWKSSKQEVSQAFQTQYLKKTRSANGFKKFLCCSIDILNNPWGKIRSYNLTYPCLMTFNINFSCASKVSSLTLSSSLHGCWPQP